MYRCAVIVHLYYEELIEELVRCVENIDGIQNDVFITIPEKFGIKTDDIAARFGNSQIRIVKNVGYDIWPFLSVINSIDLNDYDFIIKLHTKRNLPGNEIFPSYGWLSNGAYWRNHLIEMIGSRQNFIKTLKTFENEKVGMVSNYLCLCHYGIDPIIKKEKYYSEIKKIMNKYEMDYMEEARFVAGTMFMARAHLFKFLQNKFDSLDFFPADVTHKETGLPHLIERILGYSVYAQGYDIVDWNGRDSVSAERFFMIQKEKRELVNILRYSRTYLERLVRYCERSRKFLFWRNKHYKGKINEYRNMIRNIEEKIKHILESE